MTVDNKNQLKYIKKSQLWQQIANIFSAWKWIIENLINFSVKVVCLLTYPVVKVFGNSKNRLFSFNLLCIPVV